MSYTLLEGSNLDLLPTLPDCSVDAIVTDPPYELGFMGKSWDASGIAYSVELWRECLRVLKHGGHLLAFGGSRTYHRLACAVEDAGFEIRDQIMWVYGSGFPKSLDISKAIDKNNGEIGRLQKFTAWMRTTGITAKQINDATGTFMGSHYTTAASQPAIPTVALWEKIRPLCTEVPAWVDELVQRIEAERQVIGTDTKARSTTGKSALPTTGGDTIYQTWDVTAPSTDEAKKWSGWGTALKPAHEPIVVARKPLDGTVANNVLKHGVGGLNIDACRVDMGDEYDSSKIQRQQNYSGGVHFGASGLIGKEIPTYNHAGRFPANFIHDGSEEVLALFPNTKSGTGAVRKTARGMFGLGGDNEPNVEYGDSGSAARFFYCAKASKAERNAGLEHMEARITNEITPPNTKGAQSPRAGANRSGATQNFHPTVKPLALMRYLIRMITPPNGTVLDPFAGSGTTLVAAIQEGMNPIGIELTQDYWQIIHARCKHAEQTTDLPLFPDTP